LFDSFPGGWLLFLPGVIFLGVIIYLAQLAVRERRSRRKEIHERSCRRREFWGYE